MPPFQPMRLVLALTALVATIGSATAAEHGPYPLGPVAGAEATVREMISRDLSTVLTTKDKQDDDRRFLSPDLFASFTAKARDFDADPYTGVQDDDGLRIEDLSSTSVSPDRAVVDVRFSSPYEKTPRRISYDMRRAGSTWRVHDVTYHADGRSMRQILKR